VTAEPCAWRNREAQDLHDYARSIGSACPACEPGGTLRHPPICEAETTRLDRIDAKVS
jgi:hypothetical protein